MSLIPFGFWKSRRIITNGLVLYLDAGNKNSYPGSGTTWTDLSPSGNNGTISGATFDSAVSGNFSFNGSSNYVILSNTTGTMNLDYITISAWVKANSSTFGWIISGQYNASNIPWHLNIKGNNSATLLDGIASFGGSWGGFWINSDATTDIRGDGKWHYVAGTFNGTDFIYYVDGVSDSSATYSSRVLPKGTLQPRIGHYTQDSQYFGGNIAEIQIYNRALSSDEIKYNFISTRSRYGV